VVGQDKAQIELNRRSGGWRSAISRSAELILIGYGAHLAGPKLWCGDREALTAAS
jgi:hypothetical protein